MALRAYELVLFVRAQNQASATLRRVAGDVRALSRATDLANAQEALAIRQTRRLDVIRGRSADLARIRTIQMHQSMQQQLQDVTKLRAAAEAAMRARPRDTFGRFIPITRYRRQVEAAMAAEAALNTSLRATAAEIDRMPPKYIRLARSQIATKEEADRLTRSLALNRRELLLGREAQIALAQAVKAQRWDRLAVGASTASHFGRLLQLAGLISAAAIGVLAHQAAQFNQQATLVATQMGVVGRSFEATIEDAERLGNVIVSVMPDATASSKELSDAAYDLFSSLDTVGKGFLTLEEGTQLLKLSSDAAIAGMSDVGVTADTVISIMQNFDITADKMRQTMDTLFAAVRFGRMSFPEFASTMSTTVPAARAAGQSLDTLAGSMAFLTRYIPNVRVAGIAFARLTEILSRAKFVQGLREFGVEITDTQGKLLQLPEVIERITTAFPQLTRGGIALVNFFKAMSGTEGTIQARRAFVALAQNTEAYQSIIERVAGSQGEFNKALNAMERTPRVRFQKTLNQLRAFGLELGASVIPVVERAGPLLQRLTRWFDDLDEGTRNNIGRFAAYAAGLTLVGGTALSVLGMLGGLLVAMNRFGPVFAMGTAALSAMVAAMFILTGHGEDLEALIRDLSGFVAGQFTRSWKNAITVLALVAVATLKLRKAIIGLMGAQALGFFVSGGGLVRGITTLGRFNRMLATTGTGLSTTARVARVASAGVALLPGSFLLTIGAMAAFSGAAFLWNRHAESVRRKAEELERSQKELAVAMEAPINAARRFGQFGFTIRDLRRTELDIADAKDRLAELEGQLAQTPQGTRDWGRLRRDIERVRMEIGDLQVEAGKLRVQAVQNLAGFNKTLGFQLDLLGRIGRMRAQANTYRKVIEQLERPIDARRMTREQALLAGRFTQEELEGFVAGLESGIQTVRQRLDRVLPQLRESFNRSLQQMRIAGLFGQVQEIPEQVRETLLQLQLLMRQPLTARGLEFVVPLLMRTDLDDAAKRRLIAERWGSDVARMFDEAQEIARGQIARMRGMEIPQRFFDDPNFENRIRLALQNQRRAATSAASQLKRDWGQALAANLTPEQAQFIQLGMDVASGIGIGIRNNSQVIHDALKETLSTTVKIGVAEIEAGSPSRLTERTIGLPYAQGIAKGILKGMPEVLAAGSLQLELLNDDLKGQVNAMSGLLGIIPGAKRGTLGPFTQFLVDQAKDAEKMWNRLGALAQRGAPELLLEQIAALGKDGAPLLRLLVNASDKELARYVRAWQRAQRLISGEAEQTQTDIQSALENANREIEQAAGRLSSIYLNFRRENQQLFGDLFSGPWLNSEFGQVAEEWGIEPTIRDLTKDLRMQLNEFNRFNSALSNIARRGGPAELITELKALGPDALEKIETLRRAAPAQFNEFVSVWRQKQAAIEEATKIDFDKQLEQWFRYGKGIAQQIIFGLRSENVALDNAFKKYITDRFPNYINEAIRNAQGQTPPRTEDRTTFNPPPKPRMPSTTTAPTTTTVIDNTKIEVNAQPGEATLDTARRAQHLWKTGARNKKRTIDKGPQRRGGR